MEYGVGVELKALRQLAPAGNHPPHSVVRQGECPLQPWEIRGVGTEVREVLMTADVIPVDVGGYSGDVLVSKGGDSVKDAADAKPASISRLRISPVRR